jgi:glc operon protein GlcG
MRHLILGGALLIGSLVGAGSADAQLLTTRAISLESAKAMATAAEAEAARNNWPVAIAIVDINGELILLHRRDGTQLASIDIAIGKARTAARFRRPSKALEDMIVGGRSTLLSIDGILPVEGGLPVTVEGVVIGGIGVSGVASQQDEQIAAAGLTALRP